MSSPSNVAIGRAIAQLVILMGASGVMFGLQQKLYSDAKRCKNINLKEAATPAVGIVADIPGFDRDRHHRRRGDGGDDDVDCSKFKVEKRVGLVYRRILAGAVVILAASFLTTMIANMVEFQGNQVSLSFIKAFLNATMLVVAFIVFSLVGINSAWSVVGFTLVMGISAPALDSLINTIIPQQAVSSN